MTEKRAVILGAAGFIGSHLADRFLAEGWRVTGVDNLITGTRRNLEHLSREPRFDFVEGGHLRHARHRRADPRGPRLRLARLPDRLPEAPVRDAARRVDRRGEHAQAGEARRRAVRALVHLRGVRRPARAPAARELLGKREPHRPARRLRRGEAVRRGDHDGVPALREGRRPDRPHLQHLRAAHAARRRPGGADVRRPGAARRGDHPVRGRVADAELLLRRRQRRGRSGGSSAPATRSR